MKKILLLVFLIALAACSATPSPIVTVPTLAMLPTEAPTLTPASSVVPAQSERPTEIPLPSPTPIELASNTPLPSATPTETFTPAPTPTETLLPSATATKLPSATATFTFTPSLTITNTRTPIPSPTFTASPELNALGMLALLSERATVLPPEKLYNPQTLTAVAFAAQTRDAGAIASPAVGAPNGGVPELATLPPANITCLAAPPAALTAADPVLAQSVGCPQGALLTTTTAVQSFEHGTMIYVQGSPGTIYALTFDGRFRRFEDSWVPGVDPETGGETPPLGLLEPKRGFGKVWRSNLDVRGALGWGVTEEEGASSSVQPFEHGRAIYLPQRGETYLLIDDLGGATGSWRTIAASF